MPALESLVIGGRWDFRLNVAHVVVAVINYVRLDEGSAAAVPSSESLAHGQRQLDDTRAARIFRLVNNFFSCFAFLKRKKKIIYIQFLFLLLKINNSWNK